MNWRKFSDYVIFSAGFVLFMFMGLFCGYFAGRLFKTLATPKSDWKSAALQSALLYPGVIFGLSFFLNFFIWGKKSSGAVPFTTMICILLLWFGISGIEFLPENLSERFGHPLRAGNQGQWIIGGPH